ncbi:hypothetical protein CCHR01_15243 [Colletotrichum chrysophilum]|uniref:Uncharacterized protein n=1 Tax=Colletotrichum chrysophilum TaxID=1836956 RepID=A0AAD9EER0_9PEZI|nr:hypothetical protein CCHR01_15243 [Colletotrichum chrysophilum]
MNLLPRVKRDPQTRSTTSPRRDAAGNNHLTSTLSLYSLQHARPGSVSNQKQDIAHPGTLETPEPKSDQQTDQPSGSRPTHHLVFKQRLHELGVRWVGVGVAYPVQFFCITWQGG